MGKVLIYGGTTEGRILAKELVEAGVETKVCVATEYGEQVIEPAEGLTIAVGRLTAKQMEDELGDDILAVVDATHPYATEVSENIVASMKDKTIPLLRLARDTGALQAPDTILADSPEQCAQFLMRTEGNILLTTGSKELGIFAKEESLRARLYVRVLPGQESLALCYEAGLEGKQIIAMQGPFGVELNEALIRQYDIRALVTKESGRAGGFAEKLEAAARCKIPVYIISKPAQTIYETEYTMEEVLDRIEKLTGVSIGQAKAPKVLLAGMGLGMGETLTLQVREALRKADYLFGAPRLLGELKGRIATYPLYRANDILPILDAIPKSRRRETAVVLFSGDTGFYSGAEKLYEALCEAGYEAEILPGISSLSAFAAKLGKSWQDARLLSTHGVEELTWKREVSDGILHEKKCMLLTSGGEDLQKIAGLIRTLKLSERVRLFVGSSLGYPTETVGEVTLEELEDFEEKGLYVLCIENEAPAKRRLVPGLKDEQLIRGQVPMTKEEIRTLSLSKLGLTEGSVLYDIGSGTGSISVEAALLSPTIRVIAFESDEEALQLTIRNKMAFGLNHIAVVPGVAPDTFAGMPVPTHAFIGGSRGRLREILASLREKNPAVRVVMNAVTLESIASMQQLLKEFGVEEVEITQIAVSRARSLGEYHLLQAANPVFIFAFSLGKEE